MAGSDDLKNAQKETWAAGDYPEIAKSIESCADIVVAATGVASGETLLDVACGNGNASLAAARRGAQVTGVDFTPGLLEAARERAAAEDLDITFDEGDAESLPYEDDSFDRVSSVFGVMFAPDQEKAASELLRVCKPNGAIAVSAWTPGGLNGQIFPTLGKHMGPPPEGFKPPVLWGEEDHVRELFAGAADIRCETCQAEDAVRADSVDAWLDHIETVLGPMVLAKAALEPEGRWDAVRADLRELFERYNEADDGTIRAHPDYLLTAVSVAP